ncbi:MAG: PAS domain-containing protein, partial [Magnetococcus sp. WYHC-3]
MRQESRPFPAPTTAPDSSTAEDMASPPSSPQDSLAASSFDLISAYGRLQSTLHNATEGIITFAADGRVESFNRTAQKIFGYTESEIIGRRIPHLIPVPPRYQDNVAAYIRECFLTGLCCQQPIPGRHKNGANILLALSTGEVADHEVDLFQDEAAHAFTPLPSGVSLPADPLSDSAGMLVCFLR